MESISSGPLRKTEKDPPEASDRIEKKNGKDKDEEREEEKALSFTR